MACTGFRGTQCRPDTRHLGNDRAILDYRGVEPYIDFSYSLVMRDPGPHMMTRTVLLLAVASAVASAQQSTASSSAPEIVNTGSGEVRARFRPFNERLLNRHRGNRRTGSRSPQSSHVCGAQRSARVAKALGGPRENHRHRLGCGCHGNSRRHSRSVRYQGSPSAGDRARSASRSVGCRSNSDGSGR